jgi:enoyl-CoA hydratase/carnithine racemase
MLGERVGAEKLHDLGVVNRICEPGQSLGTALNLSEVLNKRAPNALTSIKELLYEADAASLNQQLASERDHFVKNLHHVNGGIGINAFLNKEKPKYE